jgi:hypothetical protein
MIATIGMVLFIVFLLRELLFPGFREKEDERKKRD